MGQRIALYYPEAPSGYYAANLRGTNTLAAVYSDFDCTAAISAAAQRLSSTGRALFYVNDAVDITVTTSSGVEVVSSTPGVHSDLVTVQSESFTGTDEDGNQSAGGRLSLTETFDNFYESFGARDGLVRETGTNVDRRLADALADVRATNAQVFNVKQSPYNAAGDGVTNDDAAVLAAYNALVANGGGELYFPAGTYILSQTLALSLSGNTIIVSGDGQTTSVIVSSNGVAALTFTNGTIYLQDIGIECTVDSAQVVNVAGTAAYADRVLFDGVTAGVIGNVALFTASYTSVRNCTFENSPTAAAGRGQFLTSSSTALIEGCVFESFSTAPPIKLYGGGAVRATIVGNTFASRHTTGYIYVESVTSGADSSVVATGNTVVVVFNPDIFIYVLANTSVTITETGNALQNTSTSGGVDAVVHAGAVSSGNVKSSSRVAIYSVGASATNSPRVGADINSFIANANYTLAAPVYYNTSAANPYNGQEIQVHIHNSTGGAITMTLAAGYRGTATNLAAGTTRVYRFRYTNTGTLTGWIQQGAIIDVT